MNYDNLIVDFMARTRKNLELIRQSKQEGSDAYEVTQLINSMLGLLVLPEQHYFDEIPTTSISELKKSGWPEQLFVNAKVPTDLRDLMRLLRNSIAHFNIKFIDDNEGAICGIKVWNRRKNGEIDWDSTLPIGALESVVDSFSEVLNAVTSNNHITRKSMDAGQE